MWPCQEPNLPDTSTRRQGESAGCCCIPGRVRRDGLSFTGRRQLISFLFHSNSEERTGTPGPVHRQGKQAAQESQAFPCRGSGRLFLSAQARGGHRSGNINCLSADSISTPAPIEMQGNLSSVPAREVRGNTISVLYMLCPPFCSY